MARRKPKLTTERMDDHEERAKRKQPVFAPDDPRFGAGGGRGRGIYDRHCRVCDFEHAKAGELERQDDGYNTCIDTATCYARVRAAADARAAAIEPVHIGR